MSVSEIKQIKEEQKHDKVQLEKPKFLMETTKLTKAEIGTITHYVLQKLDLKKEYTKNEIEALVQKLVQSQMITQVEAEAIQIEKIYTFTKNEFAARIRKSNNIYQEVPFYTYLRVDEIYQEKSSDNILVQGIIDLYFEENDGIVLVDYKTDYVNNEQELVKKHKEQLKIYKQALEEATNKKVKEVYLYSTYLDKAIKM